MRRIRRVMAAAVLGAVGCGPAQHYVEADRATYEVVEPEYRAYVTTDPELDTEQVERRLRLLDSWKMRLESGLR